MLRGIYSTIYGDVDVSVSGGYVFQYAGGTRASSCFIAVTLKSWSGQKLLDPTTYFKRNKRWNENVKKKVPGLDLITARILKELPKEGLVNWMHIFNTILRLKYWPKSLKTAQIIMTIPKHGKNPMDISSYRPISLLPTISKVLEKLILKKINKDMNPQDWITNHQFGFHRLTPQCNNASV
jgi:hypothetical protein